MDKDKLDRRHFLQAAAVAASLAACSEGESPSTGQQPTPSPASTPKATPDKTPEAALEAGALPESKVDDRPFTIAVIGCGSQATFNLIPAAMRIPGNEIVAVCDIVPARVQLAQKMTGGKAKVYSDYKKLLATEKVDGVIIATPLSTHRAIVEEAFKHGHDVFCEKAMALTVEGCRAMLAAQRKAGAKVLQIGHHLRYHPLYFFAKNHYIDPGLLGDRINNVHCVWNRNGTWRNPLPRGAKAMDFTKWGFDSPEHLFNWRLYRKYSGGLMTELASHQMDVVNWFLAARPEAVMGAGKIDNKDGRTIFDNVHLIYEYPNDTIVTYESITTNSYTPFGVQAYEVFQGEKGTLVMAHLSRYVGLFFLEPGVEEDLWMTDAHRLDVGFENIVSDRHKKPIVLNGMPSPGSRLEIIAGILLQDLVDIPKAQVLKSSYELELIAFKRAVLDRKLPRMHGRIGLEIAVTVLKGLEAMEKGQRIVFTPQMFSPTAPSKAK